MNPAEPNYLKAWRQAAGLTKAQVEKILGWLPTRVSLLEHGEAAITEQVLQALAPYYGASEPADLLRGPPPSPAGPPPRRNATPNPADKLRQQAAEIRQAAAIPTVGSHETNKLLLATAEKLEYQAAKLEMALEGLGKRSSEP